MEEAKTKTYADILHEAIERRNYSLAAISREAGVPYDNLWRAVHGRFVLNERHKPAVADLLGIEKSTFMELCAKERLERRQQGFAKRKKWEREKRNKYTVYDKHTDLPIIIDGTADKCAAAMGVTVDSFWSARSRFLKPRKQKDERWEIYKEEEL